MPGVLAESRVRIPSLSSPSRHARVNHFVAANGEAESPTPMSATTPTSPHSLVNAAVAHARRSHAPASPHPTTRCGYSETLATSATGALSMRSDRADS